MTENELSTIIIGCAIKVHSELGAGLLESVYTECLFYELQKAGLHVQKEVYFSLVYKEITFERGYRLDLWVENKVIIEVKAVLDVHPVFQYQLQTYLKLCKNKLGLLINFNVPRIKDGVQRIANGI